MSWYLQIDGLDDYALTPVLNFNEVILTASIEYDDFMHIPSANHFWVEDGAYKVTSSYNWLISFDGGNVWSPMNNYTHNTEMVTFHMKTTADTPFNTHVDLFWASNGFNCIGKFYDIKFLLNGVVQAHYDLSQGNMEDQSGNGKHAELHGGTWVEVVETQIPEPEGNYYLQMDGVDDYIHIPSEESYTPYGKYEITFRGNVGEYSNKTESMSLLTRNLPTVSSTNGFGIYITPSGHIYVEVKDSDIATGNEFQSTQIVADGKIHTIRIELYNNSQTLVFLDNIQIGTIEYKDIGTIKHPIRIGISGDDWWEAFKGDIFSVRVYDDSSNLVGEWDFVNTQLADRVGSNNALLYGGTWISNINIPPTPTIVSVSRYKISDEAEMNQSIIKVKFDQDVSEYVARLNGVNYATGDLVHEGGALTAGQEGDVIIDWTELTTEGENRINIYGRNSSGNWTLYTFSNNSEIFTYGTTAFGTIKYGYM